VSRNVTSIAVNLAARIDAEYCTSVTRIHSLNLSRDYAGARAERGAVRSRVCEILIEALRRGPENGEASGPQTSPEAKT